MNCKHILLCVLIIPVSFTIYGQESNEQRIKELEDAWLQKARKLSDLGEEIENKKQLLISIAQEISCLIKKTDENLNQQENIQLQKSREDSLNKFKQKFFSLLRNNRTGKINIEGFLIEEITTTQNDNTRCFNSDKFDMIRLLIEFNYLIKLLEKYELRLQKLLEIDKELNMLLGKPFVD